MLRDYQIRVIDETRDKLRKFNRVLIQLPTGGGKTACAAYIIKSALEKGKRSLFLAHRQEIAYQASATLKKFGVPHGFIMSSEPYISSEFVQIGMIETVRRRLSKLSGIDVVIVDEAHHSTSNSWKKVIDFFCSAGAKTVGLSATPQRLDGKGLIDIFDDIVIGPSVKDLICSGNLAAYKYYAPPAVANLDGIKKKFGEFDQQMLAERLDRPQVFGDAISHYKNIIPGKKAIAFHINIQASKNFTLQCLESGIVCRHVDGTMRPSERSEILESFENGDTEILSNVDLLGEGLDVKACVGIVMLRRTASLSKYLQMIGRAFRVHETKEFGVILDHVNNISIHDLPDDDRTWSLNGKISKAKESKEIVNIKQCTQCFYVFKPQSICPNCGFEHIPEPLKVDFVDTTLIEIERIEKKAKTIEVNKARSLDELKLIAKQRGYKPAWALIKFKSRKHYTKGAST